MSLFKTKEKAALDAAVREAGRQATALVVEQGLPADHLFQPTATHFGGNPYFEAGDVWPMLEDAERPYDFVCQVDLRACPSRPDVPFQLFTVFLSWHLVESAPYDDRSCFVRTYRDPSPTKAIRLPRPDSTDVTAYRVRPCSVRTEPFATYPWSMKRYPEVTAAASTFRDPNAAYAGSLKRLGFLHEYRSRVGGHPTWVHDDTMDDEDLVFLAQIDYEPAVNNRIGDAAPIFIAVSRSEPARIVTDVSQSF